MKRHIQISVIIISIIFLASGLASTVHAGPKTFPAGSYILPLEPCWQPNNDPSVIAQPAYCDTDADDQGVFQAYGMIYDLLDMGVPIYWIIKPNKLTPHDTDMSVLKSGTAPAVKIYHSTALSDSGTLAQVDYLGGPFVIDINDITPEIESNVNKLLGIGAGGIYLNQKLHQVNYDFTADVEKILFGVPPKVAVLGEGATQVLLNYLMSSGLGNRAFDIFTQVTTPEIIGDILDNFQLLWMPHWVIDQEVPAATDRTLVIGKIRSFLEAGNSGFFECASIESLEGSYDVTDPNKGVPGVTGTGFLINKADTAPRLETNRLGKTFPVDQMVFENVDNFLVQCGGWQYQATGGHVHNFRPNQESGFSGGPPPLPEPDYVYNSTVTRYIHANDDPLVTGYSPMGYDFYVGGRINGAVTQGYVSYLAGHKYIGCNTKNTPNPSTRTVRLEFDTNLSSGTVVTVEAVHAGCTQGSTCPKAAFDMLSQSGQSQQDDTILVDMDIATYNIDPLTSKYWLEDIKISNRLSSVLPVVDIYITFESTPLMAPPAKLNAVRDTTTTTVTALCTPNSVSPVSCLGGGVISNAKTLDLTFDTPLDNTTTVYFEAVHSGCSKSTNPSAGDGTCPVGTYDLATGTGVGASDGTVEIAGPSVFYDAATNKLNGIVVNNLTGAPITIDSFNTEFTGTVAATQLIQVDDITTPQVLCTPNMPSVAACPPTGAAPPPPPPGPVVSKDLEFEFKKIDNDKIVTIEAVYAGCVQGSTCPVATYTAPPNQSGTIGTDGNIEIDLTSASLKDGKKIQNVTITNKSGFDITITRFVVDFPDKYWKDGDLKDNELKKIKNKTDGDTLWDDGEKNPPVEADVTLDLTVSGGGGGGGGTPGSLNFVIDPNGVVGGTSFELGEMVTECDIDWSKSNTCGIRYVLNTLFGLQFQVVPNEYSKAQPILKDNILYKSTFEYPGYKGHLYAFDAKESPAIKKWDAGASAKMPNAGTTNPAQPSNANATRFIFTNTPGTTTKIDFESTNLAALKPLMFVDDYATISDGFATAVINSVRGRNEASETDTDGTGNISKRLGGIEHSTPALLERSLNIRDGNGDIINRDRVLLVGGHDGMFHAIYAGVWDSLNSKYILGTGKEIWAYIPSSLLSSLRKQTFTNCNPEEAPDDLCYPFPVAVSVNSSPAIGDFFLDIDGDGNKEYRTILFVTATVFVPGETLFNDANGNGVQDPGEEQTNIVNQGLAFALDVTDPYDPQILWERVFPGTILQDATVPADEIFIKNYYPSDAFPAAYKSADASNYIVNMGNSRGSAIGKVQSGSDLNTYIFLTTRWVDPVPVNGKNVYGISVFALDFLTGDIKWSNKLLYTGDTEGVNETPAIPSLMDVDNNSTQDYLIVGDMQGRLWAFRTNDGVNVSSSYLVEPAYVVKDNGVPTGSLEPIGASVAIYRQAVIFGTGGRDSLAGQETYNYRIFGVGITSTGADVLPGWPADGIQLQQNEKVWAPPVIDAGGTIYIGTGIGYTELGRPDVVKTQSTGRLLRLDISAPDTTLPDAIALEGAVIGGIDIENRHAYLITFNGTVYQVGDGNFTSTVTTTNPFKALWWRKL